MKPVRAWYPFVVAIFPILFLFSHNMMESSFQLSMWAFRLGVPITITLSVTFVLWVVLQKFFKDAHKTGLLLSTLIIMFFTCGHVYNIIVNDFGISVFWTIRGVAIGPYKLYLVLWGGLLPALTYKLHKTQRTLGNLTRFLNSVALVLLGMSLMLFVWYGRRGVSIAHKVPLTSFDPLSADTAAFPHVPDIYYIILDEYAAAETLQTAYHYDNQPFLDFLTAHGFYIASQARSNYTFTVLSLASSLNMTYINQIAHQLKIGENLEASDILVPVHMVEHNAVVTFLKSQGYRFIHFQTGYPPTEFNHEADWDVRCDRKFIHDRFIKVLLETTLLEPIFRRVAAASKHESIQCQFATLATLPDVESPFFVFAHLMVPHAPYVFHANGDLISPDEQQATQEALYLEQLRYTNAQVQALIETILAYSRQPPVIVLQSDHGIRHHALETHLDEWTRILNAYYFPPGSQIPVYDSISPVNTFRLILNAYFNTTYPLLPDEAYILEGTAYNYRFTAR